MGLLQLAGVVSGAGAGMTEGLKSMQSAITYWGLQSDERAFQSEKLKEQMAHAERLQAKTEAGAMARLEKSEAGATERLGKQLASQEANVGQQISSTESVAEQNRLSQEKIASEGRASQERIAQSNADATKAIHDADRALKKHEIDITEKSTEKTVTAKALAEVGNEITRLSVIAKDPMLDRASPEYKMVTDRLKRLERLHDAYSSVLRPKGFDDTVASAPKQAPIVDPFSGKIKPSAPPVGTSPAPAAQTPSAIELPPVRRGGLIQVPPPSEEERQMMQKALDE